MHKLVLLEQVLRLGNAHGHLTEDLVDDSDLVALSRPCGTFLLEHLLHLRGVRDGACPVARGVA